MSRCCRLTVRRNLLMSDLVAEPNQTVTDEHRTDPLISFHFEVNYSCNLLAALNGYFFYFHSTDVIRGTTKIIKHWQIASVLKHTFSGTHWTFRSKTGAKRAKSNVISFSQGAWVDFLAL